MTVRRTMIVTDFSGLKPDRGVLPAGFRAAVTIGNFDGCHLGHQALINKTILAAEAGGLAPSVVTFDPHPEAFFRPQDPARLPLLFTSEQKARAFRELGLVVEVRQPFDAAFSQVSHAEFYEDHLRTRLHAQALVVGSNFRFGTGRKGDAGYLSMRGRDDEITVSIVAAATAADEAISSTRVRSALVETGDVEAANEMLGRPYLLEGRVAHGDKLGRTMGFPTANLGDFAQAVPRLGVYAGWVWLGTGKNVSAEPDVMRLPPAVVPAVFNIGVRPTLKNPAPALRIEAHILNTEIGANALYERRVGYYLTHRLRDECRFNGLDELKRQIALDLVEARRRLNLN